MHSTYHNQFKADRALIKFPCNGTSLDFLLPLVSLSAFLAFDCTDHSFVGQSTHSKSPSYIRPPANSVYRRVKSRRATFQRPSTGRPALELHGE